MAENLTPGQNMGAETGSFQAEIQPSLDVMDALKAGDQLNMDAFMQKFKKLSQDQRQAVNRDLRTIAGNTDISNAVVQKMNSGNEDYTEDEKLYRRATVVLENSEYKEQLNKGPEIPLWKRIGSAVNEQFSKLGRIKTAAIDGGKSMLKDAWGNIKRGWQKLRGAAGAAAGLPGKGIDAITSRMVEKSRDESLAELLAKLGERYQSVLKKVEGSEESDENLQQDLDALKNLFAQLEDIYMSITEMMPRANFSEAGKAVSQQIDAQQSEFDAKVIQVEAILKRLEGPSVREKVVSAVENFGRRTFSKDGRLEGKVDALRKKESQAGVSLEAVEKQIESLVAGIAQTKAELDSTQSPEGAESRKVLKEQIEEMETKLESALRKKDQLMLKERLYAFDVAITEQKRKLESLKKKKDDPEAFREIADIMLVIRSLEQARSLHVKEFGSDPTESTRTNILKTVGKSFSETGRMAAWTFKDIFKDIADNREQAFWLILQVVLGAAGGAPLLLGVSGAAVLREAVRAGVIPAEKLPILNKFMQERKSADVYQGIAGKGPEEFLREIMDSDSEEPEDLNSYQKGFRRFKNLLGKGVGLVGGVLVRIDRKVLGVMNQGVEKRAVRYSREMASTVLEGANADNIQPRFADQLRGRFNVDALRAMVAEGNYETAEQELALMEQMRRDIADLRAQGGALAGGEAFGLRQATVDTRLFAPDVLDAWEDALREVIAEAVTAVTGTGGGQPNERLKRRVDSLQSWTDEKASEKAANRARRKVFVARLIRISVQAGATQLVQDALRGQSVQETVVPETAPETPPNLADQDTVTFGDGQNAESIGDLNDAEVVPPVEVQTPEVVEPEVVRPEPIPPTIPEGTDTTLRLDNDTELDYVTEVNGEPTIDTSLPGWQVWGQQELGFDNPWNFYNAQVESMRDAIVVPDVHSVDEFLPVNGMTNILADLTPLGPDGLGQVPLIPNETIADMTEYYWNSANQGEPVWEAMNVMRNGTPTIDQINLVRESFDQPIIEQS